MKYNLVQEIDGIKIELKIEADGRKKGAQELVLELQDWVSYRINDIVRNRINQEDNQ